jgi:ABC-type sulfate transport system permease subunit
VIQTFLPILAAAIVLYFVGGWVSSLAAIVAVLTGNVLFPILLPWIPTHNFSTKGFLLGVLAAIPFALSPFI